MIYLDELDLSPFEEHDDWGREVIAHGDRDYTFRWDADLKHGAPIFAWMRPEDRETVRRLKG